MHEINDYFQIFKFYFMVYSIAISTRESSKKYKYLNGNADFESCSCFSVK